MPTAKKFTNVFNFSFHLLLYRHFVIISRNVDEKSGYKTMYVGSFYSEVSTHKPHSSATQVDTEKTRVGFIFVRFFYLFFFSFHYNSTWIVKKHFRISMHQI